MLRTLFWFMWLAIYLVRTLPAYVKAKRLGKQGKMEQQQAVVHKKVKSWAVLLLKRIKVPLVIEGLENLPEKGDNVMFAANHQSYIDIPVLLAGLDYPRPILARKEIGRVPILGKWMQLLGCIFVDRDNARAAVGALRQAEQMLKEGQDLVVYPEGTRSQSDEMGVFQPGMIKMACKAGVPVVPIVIDGTWKVLEGNGWKLKKTTVRMVILPAVPTEGLSREEQKALPEKLHDMIQKAKDEGKAK